MNNSIKQRSAPKWSSHANHTQIINDEHVQKFLKSCRFPQESKEISDKELNLSFPVNDLSKINKHILTVEGSHTIVRTKKDFPSSEIAFFQFGAVLFSTDDLGELAKKPFIFPEDMKELHNLQRAKLAIPIRNVTSSNQRSLNESIRKEIYHFFVKEKDGVLSLMDTLSWLIFEEYKENQKPEYVISSNPNIGTSNEAVTLNKRDMRQDYTFDIGGEVVYLTDVFRLHEAIDEDFGASGIIGYISRLIEQFLLVRYLHAIYKLNKAALDDFVFISNGPLSFSGQTANMHKVFRSLFNFLNEYRNICFVGVEKSGPFVEHAREICQIKDGKFFLDEGSVLMMSNDYIYRYVTPGDSRRMHYGCTSYYGGKLIVHTIDDQVFVITLPISHQDVILSPNKTDYPSIDTAVSVLKQLKCDMYDDTIIPVAIVNKLIGLTGHPSKAILDRFAKKATGK